MEDITIIKANDDQHLFALYNPDNVKEFGITASALTKQVEVFNAMGADRIFIGQLMHAFIMPYFKEITQDKYADYKPMFVNFKQLPDDMVLLAVQFCKKSLECDGECSQCPHNPRSVFEDTVQDYIDEYFKEKNIPLDESQEIRILHAESLNDIFKACKILPIDYCIDSSIIECNNNYYLSFSFSSKKWRSIEWNIALLGEFGEWEDPTRYEFLKEHGTIVSNKLSELCKSGLID